MDSQNFQMTEIQRAGLTQQIVQVCNCNVETAIKLLSYCNWDVLAAINLHFSGFDINKIPQTENPAPAAIVQPLNHDLYTNFQEEAKKMNKWAMVYIKISSKDISIFDRFSMYDFVETRFHCLSLDPEDVCTKWFIDYFNITTSPSLVIINPFTGELVDKLCSDLNSSRVTNFITDFLTAHRDLGGSLDFDLNCADPVLTDDSHENLYPPSSPSNKQDDNSDLFSIVIETSNKKRTNITINKDDTIKTLYQKVSLLLRLQSSSFVLIKYPNKEIRGMSSLVKDYKLNEALVKVSYVQ